MLFIGMDLMEGALSPLRESPLMAELFVKFGANPILGILVGAAVTAIIQSSSASVGILQALSVTGAISWASAIPIILGQNIGTTVTAMLSVIGASKNARRTALAHLYFNVIGTVLFTAVVFGLQAAGVAISGIPPSTNPASQTSTPFSTVQWWSFFFLSSNSLKSFA